MRYGDNFLINFGRNVATARSGRGMNKKQLAIKSGLSLPTICQCEKGNNSLGIDNAYKIAKALGISLDTLCEFKNEIW